MATATNPFRWSSICRSTEPRHVAFVIGFVMSFMMCSLVGVQVASHNIFQNFTRFLHAIAPDALYLPTVRQVRQLAVETLDKAKVNVVLGGSSVFYGVGQQAGASIADGLRLELGDSFRVINLAMRGGDASGIAELTAEMLLRDGYRVIYLTDVASAFPIQTIGSAPYRYFYWQAKALGLLLDWPLRDAAVEQRRWFDDSQLGVTLENALYFDEFWNWVSYSGFSSVFANGNQFLHRRGRYRDDKDPPPQTLYRNTEGEFKTLQNLSVLPSAQAWANVRQAADVALPAPIRPFSAVAICEYSGWLLNQMPSEVRENRRIMREQTIAIMTGLGLTAFSSCDDLADDDYIDRAHLSPSGARLIAPRLAEQVRNLSRKRGW